MKRIIVSVSNDLITDQRVTKICNTFLNQGYDILLIGRKNYSKFPVNRDYKTKRLSLLFNKGFLFYAEFNFRLFFLLLFSKKNILYANDVDTLLPNYLVSKIQNKKLIFDSHELFSEIPELVNRKFVKNFWLRIENRIIPKLKTIITVSDSIKEHYKSKYNVEPITVRNFPELKDIASIPFDFSIKNKKVILYQGSVNIGRGLELMIETMKVLDQYLLVIIGSGDIIEILERKVLDEGLENKVKFLGEIQPEKLKTLTPNATIGISLEEGLGLNYKYALPNKIFDYIHAEAPIIVSNLPEMKKIVEHFKVGEILMTRTSNDLANLIQEVSSKNYKEALILAKKELNWDREQEVLINLIKNIE